MTEPNPPLLSNKDRKAASRERILKEAASAIRLEGSERVSVQAIMARAGMTHGGFYAHFSSKDDLLEKAITYMFDDRYAAFLVNLDGPDPEKTLSQFVDNYLSMRHRDAVERGCPIPALAGEIGRLPDHVKAQFVIGMERLTQGVATLLRRLERLDSEALAGSAIAEMTGALGLSRVQPDPTKADAILQGSRSRVRARLGLEPVTA